MNKLKPWALGPYELLQHGDVHLKGKTDFDKRMSLVSFDNAIELSIITFLSLNPIQRNGLAFERSKVDEWLKNFHKKIEFFEHYVTNIASKSMEIGRDEIIYYHNLRNELYHNGNGLVPMEAHLDGIRQSAVWVFSTLFDVNIDELLVQDNNKLQLSNIQPANLSSETIFLETFVSLKKSLDLFLATTNPNNSLSLSANLAEAWQSVIRSYSDELPKEFIPAIEAAELIRNEIIDGKSQSDTINLEQVSTQLESAIGYVDSRLRQHQLEAVEKAIASTIDSIPPKGNQRAGVVWQTLGSGLGLSASAYLLRTRITPELQNYPVIFLADRTILVEQIYKTFSEMAPNDSKSSSLLPENRIELTQILESNQPVIVFSTIQKLTHDDYVFSKECIVVCYNLQANTDIIKMFPKGILILFTSTLQNELTSKEIFGNITSKFNLQSALNEGVVSPVKIEQRNLKVQKDYYAKLNDIKSIEILQKITLDIVNHFEAHHKVEHGKGVVIVPNRAVGIAIYNNFLAIKPDWIGKSESIGYVKTLSTADNPHIQSEITEKFRTPNSMPFLLITTGSLLVGYDNSFINVMYLLSHISVQSQHQLLALLSRPQKEKKSALVVDYLGLNWTVDFTHENAT